MPTQSGGDNSVTLTPRLKLQFGGMQGSAQVAPEGGAVLGGDELGGNVAANLSFFSAAEPAIELHVQASAAAVLGGEAIAPAALDYEPEEPAAYALLQAIETTEGTIYDFTLPQQSPDGGLVLGPDSGRLRFPVNPLVLDGDTPPPAVLGVEDVFGGLVGGGVGSIIVKRVLQVIKSPIEKSLLEAIRNTEGQPWAGLLRNPAGAFEPIQGFEGWRNVLPPGGERRILVFIHGFSSSLGGAGRNEWFGKLGQNYDAIIGYNHPTIWCDPEYNARELLKMIPEDLQLSVDLVAHSRGGLVARSLVELLEPQPNFSVRRLITNGSPHGGTRLADPERWDRLVSIGMTGASLLASTTGALVWVPKVLELVLKAAAQIVFDLPGVGAMTPNGAFINKLNAAAETGSAIGQAQSQVRYSAVSSRFSIFSVAHPAFQQAFNTFAAQAFHDTPNDIVVPTESMSQLDQAGLLPKERQLLAGIDHFSYFRDQQVIEFMAQQLAG